MHIAEGEDVGGYRRTPGLLRPGERERAWYEQSGRGIAGGWWLVGVEGSSVILGRAKLVSIPIMLVSSSMRRHKHTTCV